jgi:hypothetical protein
VNPFFQDWHKHTKPARWEYAVAIALWIVFAVLLLISAGCKTANKPRGDSSRAAAASFATFSTVEGSFTPGPLILPTPSAVFPVTEQFPVAVLWDKRCGVMVMRYLNPDPQVYSAPTFDGGTAPDAHYWLGARTLNDSITNWTTAPLPP